MFSYDIFSESKEKFLNAADDYGKINDVHLNLISNTSNFIY